MHINIISRTPTASDMWGLVIYERSANGNYVLDYCTTSDLPIINQYREDITA